MEYFENKNIKDYTSLKIGGIVKKFYILETIEELQNLLISIPELEKHKIRILGGGTNLLVKDEVLDLIVLKLEGEFEKIIINENKICAGAGVLLPKFLTELLKNSLSGIEVLAGIPGTVGGAVFGNAGTKYGDIAKFIKSIKIIDFQGNIENLFKKDIIFSYRKIDLSKDCIILNIEFDENTFQKVENNEKLIENFHLILQEKIKNQPYSTRNAGCVFKNPIQESVGKMVDDLGLKGYRIGDVLISEKHANFFIAEGNATSEDFINLMNFVIDKIKKIKKIELESEIKIWG